MRLLLDTHVLLWWASADRHLKKPIHALIASDQNDIAVSAATFWEIAIKTTLGRIDVDVVALNDAAVADGFETVPVRIEHTFPLASLPDLHGDPFDRLLIAQAIVESRRLVTADQTILTYAGTRGFDPIEA